MTGPRVGSPEYLAETNNPHQALRVCIAFIIIDTFFLLVFYLSRHYNPMAVRMPMFVCITLCYLFCLGSAVAGILMAKIGGAGHHVQAVPVTTFQNWLKLSKVLEFTYTPAVMFGKLAALFLYYQVFELPNYRRIIAAMGVIIILQGLISFILAFSICRPFRYFWTQAVNVNDGSCGNVMLFYKFYSIPSLVTDIIMLVVPWPILMKLRMPTSEKVGLILTFMAASVGIITCAIRFSVFFTVPLFSDPTWYASGGPTIYALVEPSIYMIASILPTTRHLYRRASRKLRENYQVQDSNRSDDLDKNQDSSQSTELTDIEKADSENRQIVRHVDIWQANTNSSQEELTLGGWYQRQQEWEQSKQGVISVPSTPEAQPSTSGRITNR